ncbi:hypothetical protein XAC3218_960249 [Xanthomonas citri pv. citri]|nr:hypothetical protein XAC3218_960249 [Xanthomonas citri pv. citri]
MGRHHRCIRRSAPSLDRPKTVSEGEPAVIGGRLGGKLSHFR